MKGGLVYANAVTTVSPTYAAEVMDGGAGAGSGARALCFGGFIIRVGAAGGGAVGQFAATRWPLTPRSPPLPVG